MHNILKKTGEEWSVVGTTPDLENLFLDPSLVLSSQGRINLHYTCHHVLPEKQRLFFEGEWLFFDFDELSLPPLQAHPLLEKHLSDLLGVERGFYVVNSGNGLHFLIRLPKYSESYLDVHKSTYNHISLQLKERLKDELTFVVDPVFQKAKSLRLPGSVNKKEGREDKECFIIARPEGYTARDLLTAYRLSYEPTFSLEVEIKNADAVKQSAKVHAPAILGYDGNSVNSLPEKSSIIEKCSFISSLQENLANMPRDLWLKAVTTLGLIGMEEEAHAWSSPSPLYKPSEVEGIISYAKEKGLHPLSCATIEQSFPEEHTKGCLTCPYKACKSPANLHNDPLLGSMGAGFKVVPEGSKKPLLDYDSLSKFFAQYLAVIFVKDRESYYQWHPDQLLYIEKTPAELTHVACSLIKPRPIDPASHLAKVSTAIEINASKEEKSMLAPEGTIPLKNGIFDIKSGTLLPYSPKILTTNKLPYDFDPLATCPNFDKFLEERIGDPELIDSVLLFLCYALAGIKQPIRKILVLEGPAATGKSTLLTVIHRLFGDLAVYGQLQNLVGRFETASFIDKRVVLFDEALSARDNALIETLKSLSGSETMKVEKKGKDPQNVTNLSRIVIACNQVPRGGALDSGFLDRLLIVPMHRTLEYSERNYSEVSKILEEGSGILNKIASYYAKLKALNFIIPMPKASVEALEEYQQDDLSLVDFIRQECSVVPMLTHTTENDLYLSALRTSGGVQGELAAVSMSDLRAALISWAEENGEKYFAEISTKKLSSMLYDLEKTTFRMKIRVIKDRNNKTFIKGLILNDPKKHSLLIKKKDGF